MIMSDIKPLKIEHTKKNMASYGFAKALNEFMDMAFTAFGFYYYESEIGLNVLLVGLGYILFAVYNAINDPLVGYLTDRPFKFTKKWGRRFPWIMLGGVVWVISYILIFSPPNVDPQSGAWILFAWLLFATCFYDTFASIFFVSFSSLYPDKFRSIEERRTANAIATPVGVLGIVAGGIVPPLFITFGVPITYVIQAGVMMIVGLILLVISIPGCREDQETIDRYLSTHDKQKRSSFFKSLRTALKQRNFVIFIITYTLYRSLVICVQSSIPYVIRFVMKMEASSMTLIMAGFLLGAIFSIPLWMKLARKTNNNRKIIMISGLFLAFISIPLSFITNYFVLIIVLIIWGIALGGFWVMLAPVLADVIDESVCITEKREEGIYMGFQQFFGRLGILAQAITFVIVHSLTGFQEGAATQSDLATFGIQLHFGIIPFVFMLIAMIVFIKWYDITPEKAKANQEKVDELCL
ncbi:MAG: MFS transporter [Promethearchaeota archaeon]|nr:MAG: MFS transporter [Candidatus Lokiarchaeota archaeon]